MSSLAERRKKQVAGSLKLGGGNKKEVRKIVPTDSIDAYYTFADKATEQCISCASVTEVDAEGKPLQYMARIIPKTSFEPVVEAGVTSNKLSEFDWRAAILAILNSRGVSTLMSFHELVEDEDRYYLIMEHTQDADVINQVLYERDLQEADIKRLVRQMLQALDSIHGQGFVHRNVSPSNIRFQGPSLEKSELKLLPGVEVVRDDPSSPKFLPATDSGHGEPSEGHEFLAPERLLGEHSAASDMWSVGVFMYIMICGAPPFKSVSTDPSQQHEAMKANPIDWTTEPWSELPVATDLCRRLLSFEPELRTPTSKDALSHPWLHEEGEQ